MTHPDSGPAVVLSVPCPACGGASEPDPECARCEGHGIVLERVAPADAARRAREITTLPPPRTES